MKKLLKIFKNMCLDIFLMGKGFIYGFFMIGLLVIIGSTIVYGVLLLKNIIF
ncbi:hypothetical protein [Bacillus sp. AFS017336]|uniref:hypothetical protein n=1 Tax=Bacillus sp. AFS017336 TaxID=2033489 RepID=UPI0015CF7DD9|nr:hypothetical protein [Bacillus sp. AFS017336]